jgi:mannose-1-phosphate guanylyltransferase/mannose-6-phosphate isomerase
MNDVKSYVLVMAGGQGTRFWPESTSKKPKQYLSLTSEKSLLEETLVRFEGLVPSEQSFVVTVKSQEKLSHECSKGLIAEDGLIFEPSGRNTAPCIILALAKLEAKGAKDTDLVAIVPSDHVILNTKGFQQTLSQAYKLASSNDKIITIGIKPNFPHTGYGYIHKGNKNEGDSFEVSNFVEKPDFETAQTYLASGEYFWNAGMFVTSLKTLKNEFKTHAPDMFEHYQGLVDSDETETAKIYEKIRKESIDYAVMEKSKNVFVQEAGFDWNDLGSWDALESVINKCDDNITVHENDHFYHESKGNIVFAPNKFVSLQYVNDLIVIDNDDVLMVLPKERAQEVKKVVEYVKTTKFKDQLT